MSPEEVLRKANRAGQLLNDPLMQTTLETMERDIMELWLACPVRDVDGREAMWRMAVTTRKFKDILRGTMESGKMAEHEIKLRDTAQPSVIERAKTMFRR